MLDYLGVLPTLPALFAVAFVCTAPFITAILMGRLVSSSVVTRLVAASEAALVVAREEKEAALVAAREETKQWREAWQQERDRADKYQGVAMDALELGKAANHALDQLPRRGETPPPVEVSLV
jgi:hypothetical protein